MHQVDKSLLRFLVMPTRFPPLQVQKEYALAYAFWKEIWTAALEQEMNVKSRLYSDNFTRQSKIALLLYNERPAALGTLNDLYLNDPAAIDDSYFQIWPEITFHRLKQNAKSVMTSCNFALARDYRRGALGICWKELFMMMMVRYLKQTEHDYMLGTARLERGMEKAAYATGAQAYAKNLPYTIEGQRVDLVSWHRDLNEEELDPDLLALVNYVHQHAWQVALEPSWQELKRAA